MTGLVCANAVGGKLPLLVIGKSAKPRCFKGVQNLPCTYRSQNKSWMDSALFTEWLTTLDRKFSARNKSVLLLVDNCSAHPEVQDLKSINLQFLPPNTTSKLQPMDQGIIRSLKAHYRNHLIRRYISHYDENNKTLPKISVLDAMTMVAKAWEAVTEATIVNCFRHSGISSDSQTKAINDSDDPFAELAKSLSELREFGEDFVPESIRAEDFLDMDNDVSNTSSAMITYDELLAAISDQKEYFLGD